MNKIFSLLSGAAILAASTVGLAGGPDNTPVSFNENNAAAGFYVEGDVGYGRYNGPKADEQESLSLSSFVWAANLGYQFNSYVALEAGFMQLPTLKADTRDGYELVKSKVRTNAVTFDVKGIYPL